MEYKYKITRVMQHTQTHTQRAAVLMLSHPGFESLLLGFQVNSAKVNAFVPWLMKFLPATLGGLTLTVQVVIMKYMSQFGGSTKVVIVYIFTILFCWHLTRVTLHVSAKTLRSETSK